MPRSFRWQAANAGIGFVPLDNAFAAVDDVAAVQAICDGLDATGTRRKNYPVNTRRIF